MLTPLLKRLNAAALWLTAPSPHLHDPQARLYARLSAALLCLLLPVLLALSVIEMLLHLDSPISLLLLALAVPPLVVAYLVSRTIYYRAAIGIMNVVFVTCWFAAIIADPTEYDTFALIVIVLVVASLFLSVRRTLLLALALGLGIMTLSLVLPDRFSFAWMMEHLTFFIICSMTVLIIAHYRNIIARQRTAELREHKNRLESILAQAADAIFVTNADGYYVEVNPKACALLGYSRDELRRLRLRDLLPDDRRDETLPRLSDLRVNQIDIQEMELQHKDGSRVVLERSASALPGGGNVSIGRDMTERRKAQEAERLRRDLDRERELGQIKNRLLSLVSHEFRTPLAVILTSSELLERYNERLPQERRNACYTTIKTQVRSLSTMLDDLSTVIRGETGWLEFNPLPLDLAALCHSLVDEMRATIGVAHSLIFNVAGEVTGVSADGALLKHLLRNLLSNAIKYSPQGCEVKLHVSRVSVQEVSIQVSDQGIGIPAADMPRLFEPYFRADNAKGFSGTGMGLTIIRQVVEMHSGRIEVASQEGAGTTFTVHLPARAPFQTEDETEPALPAKR